MFPDAKTYDFVNSDGRPTRKGNMFGSDLRFDAPQHVSFGGVQSLAIWRPPKRLKKHGAPRTHDWGATFARIWRPPPQPCRLVKSLRIHRSPSLSSRPGCHFSPNLAPPLVVVAKAPLAMPEFSRSLRHWQSQRHPAHHSPCHFRPNLAGTDATLPVLNDVPTQPSPTPHFGTFSIGYANTVR